MLYLLSPIPYPLSSIRCPHKINVMKHHIALASALVAFVSVTGPVSAGRAEKPNIIFILADDLGYGDLGCYGQQKIKTPFIDRLAGQGMRFTQFYAGSTVCAPSRCALMVAQHTGHCLVRGNARVPLRPDDVTIAEVLKSAGYTTGLIGKWGLGEDDSTGVPNLQGFDYFFGYLNQHHAHNYYPDFLWRNQEKVKLKNVVLPGDNFAKTKAEYSHDLFAKEAAEFIDKNHKRPFFLYLALTIPHANNELGKVGMEVPDDAPYSESPWPQQQRNHAAMVTRMDRDIGRLVEQLQQLGIDDNTLILFSSDNGPHREGGNDPDFFNSSGGLRGIKRSLHEGGIRVPFIARWPGKIAPGSTSDHIGAFWDVLPTLAELAGAKAPANSDGISFLPTLLAREQKAHEALYWEFHEGGTVQGVRMGNWKAVRTHGAPIELYDLSKDQGETRNIASMHPEVVARVEAYLKTARTPSEHWPIAAKKQKKK